MKTLLVKSWRPVALVFLHWERRVLQPPYQNVSNSILANLSVAHFGVKDTFPPLILPT